MQKKILLIAKGNKSWIGGVYYIKNVCYMLLQNQNISNEFEVIILCEKGIRDEFACFQNTCKILEVQSFDSFRSKFKIIQLCSLSKVKAVYTAGNHLLYRLFKIQAIQWIPDFQHNHFPEYFTHEQLSNRTAFYQSIAKGDQTLVLSSKNALSDFQKYYCQDRAHVYVMSFVSYIEDIIGTLTSNQIDATLKKYGLEKRNYILTSNQFWKHKNHKVIFEMIALLKEQNRLSNYQFIFTGELKDFRNPGYVEELKNIISSNQLEDRINILGFIDRQEQIILMKEALLLIQPSLFEGWGIVVEDGKVLDKTMLISDIPLHQEQKNNKCILFDATNPQDLFEKITAIIPDVPLDNIEAGIANMRNQAREYSKSFEQLLRR